MQLTTAVSVIHERAVGSVPKQANKRIIINQIYNTK